VALTKLPSLDLYREPDPFRVPKLKEFRDRIDVEEFATMCAAGFPEPKTFSRGVAAPQGARRRLRHRPRQPGARLRDARDREDGAAARHHHPPPDHLDRRIDLAQTRNPWRKFTLSRWYGFVRMQGRVARQARRIITPSETSKRDIAATSASTRRGCRSSCSASTTA
jgi:hypothetical protein